MVAPQCKMRCVEMRAQPGSHCLCLLLLPNTDYSAPNMDNCGELLLRDVGRDHRRKGSGEGEAE